jgi:predicted transcriptional regulator
MPCVSPDGKPTSTGMKTLSAINGGAIKPPEIAKETRQPMFRVRSGLRELVNAGFLEETDGVYNLTETGKNVL